jgi:hypothetical protein
MPDSDGDGSPDDLDCSPYDPANRPGGAEICDGQDNDCNWAPASDEVDEDGDGVMACEGDCDDHDPDLAPGQPELCNSLDDDCDGSPADWELTLDEDGDGWFACVDDCDDEDPDVHPGARDLCRPEVDRDCIPGVDWDGSHAAPLEGILGPEDAWATFVGDYGELDDDGQPLIHDSFGIHVRGPGDINGDGFDDIVITGAGGGGYPATAFFGPFCHGTYRAADADATFDGP